MRSMILAAAVVLGAPLLACDTEASESPWGRCGSLSKKKGAFRTTCPLPEIQVQRNGVLFGNGTATTFDDRGARKGLLEGWQIENTGDAVLTIEDIEVTSEGGSLELVLPQNTDFPVKIEARGDLGVPPAPLPFSVRFNRLADELQGSIVIHSDSNPVNDPGTGRIELPIRIYQRPPEVWASPRYLHVEVAHGEVGLYDVTIRNDGGMDLLIHRLTLEGDPSFAIQFLSSEWLAASEPAVALVLDPARRLAPGEVVQLRVRFESEASPQSASLRIHTNAPGEPDGFLVSLLGYGCLVPPGGIPHASCSPKGR